MSFFRRGTDVLGALGVPLSAGYPVFDTYAELPSAADYAGKIFGVTTTTGIWPLQNKAGLYLSDGSTWNYYSSLPALSLWDSNRTYALNEVAISSIGEIYRSIVASNQGNDPDSSPSKWTREVNGIEAIEFSIAAAKAYKAGQFSYDSVTKTHLADTGFDGVRNNIGQENWYLVVNNTGNEIPNGTALYASGVDVTLELLTVDIADNRVPPNAVKFLGLSTFTIPAALGSLGLITSFGIVRDFDTSLLPVNGLVYLGINGGLQVEVPKYPSTIYIAGAILKQNAVSGSIQMATNLINRPAGSKSYSFTSRGILSGVSYVGGFYDFPATDTTLDEGSLTQTHGIANNAYAAHAFSVFGGAGSVDTGQVGLRCTGVSINDDGTLNASDTDIITDDITSVSLNQYMETPKKWLGTVTYELYVVSGTPTTYSVSFNYGYAKYDDSNNRDFTVTGFEVVGLSAAADTAFDVVLYKHSPDDWVYSAAAFVAGDGIICQWSTDMGPYDNLANGEQFAYKRANLAEFIEGSADEGIVVEITTGANNSVQAMDVHVLGFLEGLG